MKYILFFCLLFAAGCEKQDPLMSLRRCQEITGVERLDRYVNEAQKMHSPKSGEYYRLVFGKQHEAEIMEKLEAQGFPQWTRGGVDYGPINEGWEPSEDLVYSMIKGPGATRLVALSRQKGVLYIIYREK